MSDDKKPWEPKGKEKKKEGPKPWEDQDPPTVVARNRGSIGSAVDGPVEQLRENNPDKEYRYVYAPEHKSDYSQVLKRRNQGYRDVDLEVEDIEAPHGEATSEVRAGDVKLMEIPKEGKEAYRKKLAERAAEDARRAEEVFRENVRSRAGKPGSRPVPVGQVERSSKEYTVDMPEEENG